ncbi:MAG: (d)CMP kinase [Clostridiales Family XIII bacterium]|jgi:cytidylate kinase|nr:(d)CMP kinase [Clostridiales Family XIII bacterium]
MIIAIDGPSGAGKSTIAKLLAKEFGIDYIDTGAMYRAVALKVMGAGTDTSDADALGALLDGTDVDFAGGQVLLDSEDVSGQIRTPEVSMEASRVSAIPAVRKKLVALQREMGVRKSVVMDGRDIGSNVFPGAEHKFFITASPEVRAERRRKELAGKGENASFEEVLADIRKRDWDDSHRALNPLVKTDDAVEIGTDTLGIEAVLGAIKKYLQ